METFLKCSVKIEADEGLGLMVGSPDGWVGSRPLIKVMRRTFYSTYNNLFPPKKLIVKKFDYISEKYEFLLFTN